MVGSTPIPTAEPYSVEAWLQLAAWQPDLASLALGVVLGLLLAFLFFRLAPTLRRLRDRSLARVQETEAWMRAGVEKRFLAETQAYAATYHLGHSWAPLDDIFVTPRLLPPRPEPAIPPAGEGPDAVDALSYLWPELGAAMATPPVPTASMRHLLLNGRRVAISAPAGAGKSTLLAFCAHACATADDTGPFVFLQPLVPVLIHLAELDLSSDADLPGADPAAPLARALQSRSGPLTAPGVGALLREKLEGSQVLLLLDGWDDLPSDAQEEPAAWLDRLLRRYPETQIIAAVAGGGYQPLLDLGFVASGIAPWRKHQAQRLGERWAEALGWPDPVATERFWHAGSSPLALTLRLWHFRQSHAAPPPPARESKLFAATLRALLPEATEEHPWLRDAARALCQQVAGRLLDEARLSLDGERVDEIVAHVLAKHDAAGSHSGALRATMLQSGLLRRWHDGSYSFLSPLWRDFLAAAWLAEGAASETVVANLEDRRWAGAIRFYVALTGGDVLAPELLNDDEDDLFQERLFQLASWLPDTPPDADWRRQALVRLGQLATRPGVPTLLRARAIAALAVSREPTVLALLKKLRTRPEPFSRQMAALALSSFDPEQSTLELKALLEDDAPAVRAAAIHALGWQNVPVGEQALLVALVSRDERLNHAVVEQLALNGGEAWEILREAAADEFLHVRRAATHGLRQLDEYWAVRLLEELERDDPEWVVRTAATVALEAVAARSAAAPWAPLQAGELPWLVEWAAEREEAVPAGATAVPVLRKLLTEADAPTVRRAAAQSLARVWLPAEEKVRVQTALQQVARNDSTPAVREAAFLALAARETMMVR
ncbi:MAG: HEAT repeat domain-containing protein [Candidatus Promineifilaceae bacterium]|nr:HEAT repeat domain-containing protein [Candidatus Promineifilaceae bacterium]